MAGAVVPDWWRREAGRVGDGGRVIPDWWWTAIALLAALLAGAMAVVLMYGAVQQHREAGHLEAGHPDTEAPEPR
jgi:hypothetical protein